MRRLESAELLQREPDPQNGRAYLFTLTPMGSALYHKALTYRRKKMLAILSGLSQDEVAKLLLLLGNAISATCVDDYRLSEDAY